MNATPDTEMDDSCLVKMRKCVINIALLKMSGTAWLTGL